LRCGDVRHDAGGGGINVARAVHRLGGEVLAIFPSGGPQGDLLERLVEAEKVPYLVIPVADDTREDFAVTETTTKLQYRFVLPGPKLTDLEYRTCLESLKANIAEARFVVASGSLPPGAPPDFYAQVARIVAGAGAEFVLDTSGPALKLALCEEVCLIKPSLREISELAGEQLSGPTSCLAAARRIITETGVRQVAVSLGENGALLVGTDMALRANAPNIEEVSSIGAGDSFLAGLIWAFAQNWTPHDALQHAVAAGSAALLAPGTGLFCLEDVARLKRQIAVVNL
jgi:6-phosphofructokinase 2